MISMIWAMDEDHLIGKDDKIPWHIKEDLLYYKSKTEGQDVLMGDVTYFSLKGYYKNRPLPYKTIYIATLDKNLKVEDDNVVIIYDIFEFLKNVDFDLFVVGGRTIYKLAYEYADRLYISLIKGHHEGNVYFPITDFSDFKLKSNNETELVNYQIYERVK